jgi:TolB protein
MIVCFFKKLTISVFLFLFVSVIFMPGLGRAAHDYIDITNPFLRKIPMAVPPFAVMSENGNESEIAINCAGLLSQALEFTGYFKMIQEGAFLDDPRKTGIGESDIKFPNWTGIGADLLVTGGISIENSQVVMELRAFDTFKAKLLVGKRYKCMLTNQRREILRFCSLIINQLTGNQGFFNSKIAFISTGTGNKEIYLCDFDGGNIEKFSDTKDITLSPAWSSDGKWIAYTSYQKGKPDLYIKHLFEDRGAVVAKKGINITPAWCPGEFALAATLSFAGDQEIYMLTGAGKIIKRLTRKWGIDVSPSFSPDGKKMCFVSKRSGTPQIYIKDLGAGHVERLTFEGKYNTTPSWSPKGDKIAYSLMENGQFNIYVIDIDGKNSIQLTQDAGDNESPSWSPDGTLITFSSTREGISRIYIMTSFGTDQRRLLVLQGEQSNPKWSPNIINY